ELARAVDAAAGRQSARGAADGARLAGIRARTPPLRRPLCAGWARCPRASSGADRCAVVAAGDGRCAGPGGQHAGPAGEDEPGYRWPEHRHAALRYGRLAVGRHPRLMECVACAARSPQVAGEAVGGVAGAGMPVPALGRVRTPRHRFWRVLLIRDGRWQLPAAGPRPSTATREAVVSLRLELHNEPLPMSAPFRIAGHVFKAMPATVVTLHDGAHAGRGEA